MALASACAARTSTLPIPAAQALLTVVSWNMHAGVGDLRALLQDLETGRLTGVQVPDYVLLLQEAVQGRNSDALAAVQGTRAAAYFAPVRDTAAGSSGNAVVSTRPLIAPRAVSLPQERQPRSAILTAIELGGEQIALICAHLENRQSWLRGGVFGDRARARQAAALLAQIPADGPAIAGGDFNSLFGIREEAVRLFSRRFTTQPTPPPRQEPTFRDRLVLDHLFFDLPAGWQARRWVSAESYGSDHRPVVGVIIGN